LSFISKNYRPKCDICCGICDIDWFTQKQSEKDKLPQENHQNNHLGNIILKNTESPKPLLLCNKCFESGKFPKSLTKDDFEFSNFFNIVSSGESKIII
jgi:hypothetical protein